MKKAVVLLARAYVLYTGVVILSSSGAFARDSGLRNSVVEYSVNVTVSPTGSGDVRLNPPGGLYLPGTRVSLTPIPRQGYAFSHWEMDLEGSNVPALLVMDRSKNVSAVFCTLESLTILSPRNGSILKVGRESNDLPIIFTASTSCFADVKRITFTLDSGWTVTVPTPDQNGPCSVTGPLITNLGYGTHTLSVTATSNHQPEVVVEDAVTFTLESAPANVDNDSNGLPDNSFSTLDADGALWISSVVVPETLNRRLTIATRWEGPIEGEPDQAYVLYARAGPIVLSLKNPARPAQIVTASVPRSLLQAGESGILIIQIAPDLVTLLGPVESQMIAAEPSVLVGGGQYVEVSVIASADNGATYAEVDSGRFDETPVHLTMKGLDVLPGTGVRPVRPSSYLIYSHESGFAHHPMFGDRVVGWQGEWTTDGLRNLVITDAAMEVDAAFLSIFAPYRAPIEGPRISLTPANGSTQDYGFVKLGSYRNVTFTLRNVGGGVLSGMATTTNDAFSVISGGLYNLDPGEVIRMTVRFMPTAAETYIGNLVIEGGGYAIIYLRGYGTRADALVCNGVSLSGGVDAPKDAAGDGLLVALCAAALLLWDASLFPAVLSTPPWRPEIGKRP